MSQDNLKVYPLKSASNPPATEFVNITGKSYNTIAPSDYSYFEILNTIIQREPIEALGSEARGTLAAIGIVKGQPFNPDARMKRLLTEAATIGDATARSTLYSPRQKGYYVYPDSDSSWVMGFADKNVFFEVDGARNLDARTSFYFGYTGVTPAMAVTHPGAGSDYAIAFRDAQKKAFDGSKTYRLHLPKDVPVNNFWAVTVYDTQTRSMLQTEPALPDGRQPERWLQAERRRLLRRLFRARGARGQGRQLGADRSRQELVHHPADVRPARALDQQDLAAERNRAR